ncbi:MAG: DUF4143 domain-containing protein, partial [Brachymonas sp.]|nr:DUF4143 domain-containing protein [Brachymonas sp.]
SAEQLARDPLWGHLFENFIVMEALKDQWHFGYNQPLYFYRDSIGHEIDLLIPEASRVHAIEIKAGATVNSDYFKGLEQFAKAHPQHLASGRVIFGGDQGQARSNWSVHAWSALRTRPTPVTLNPHHSLKQQRQCLSCITPAPHHDFHSPQQNRPRHRLDQRHRPWHRQ